MTCPVCGQAQPCAHSSEWGPGPHARTEAARDWGGSALLDSQTTDAEPVSSRMQAPAENAIGAPGLAAEPVWRREVVSRVQQHRARRRRHADPNALELDFTANEPFSFAPPPARFAEIVVRPEPKIIRFPRPAPAPLPAVQEVRLDELQPAPETPRIVEVAESEVAEPEVAELEAAERALIETQPAAMPEAEQMELLPSFADIQLEAAANHLQEVLEVIPRPAPLSQRVVAGMVDGALVVIALGAFAITFLKLAEEVPQSRLTGLCALAACGIFWLLFQYIFLTYGRNTPGMRMAQLELCNFAGERPSRFARQCRALASALSGFSAGLGYAWALIDEDQLGWHDRISQTYVRGFRSPERSEGPV